jgi:tRNA threonylcarbamoyladenosine biosynthesis protein TsaB
MAKILQIETATQTCSVALAIAGETIGLKEETAKNIHAGSLTLFIEEVMQQAGLQYQDLDAVAVSKGPGSYTGLRIGISTVKGLCFALDKPFIAIDTLKMMANGFLLENQGYSGLICPMIDARRMEVFAALFDENLEMVAPVTAKIIDADSYTTDLTAHQITFIGDGASKCSEVLLHPNANFSAENFNSAAHLSKLALAAYEQQEFEDVAYFEPYYLKDFVFTAPKKKV